MAAQSRTRTVIVIPHVGNSFNPTSKSFIFLLIHTGGPGKKSFMYFASSAGRGFIISDDEEITGVISVRNKVLCKNHFQ